MRWLSLLAAVLLACSGGAGEKCGPENCKGCCDDQNVCRSGTSEAHCGSKGEACRACKPSEACGSGLCLPPVSADGGTDGGN